MSAQTTNKVIKYGSLGFIVFLLSISIVKGCSGNKSENTSNNSNATKIHNSASNDSAAESLDTLTSQLTDVKKQIAEVAKDNEALRQQNTALKAQMNGNMMNMPNTTTLSNESNSNVVSNINTGQAMSGSNVINGNKQDVLNKVDKTLAQYRIRAGSGNALPNAASNNNDRSHFTSVATADMPSANDNEPLTTINDLTGSGAEKLGSFESRNAANIHNNGSNSNINNVENNKDKKKPIVPYYTIPANATSVHDRLMTSLVGRIPIKGVVADPYPFKIVVSDDTLAANGLRVPHLKQMIVSGYSEGDLVTSSVSGWVTSLTFVFQDGTIYNVSSNDNNIGKFTKDNALGYLSDKYGNPFIRGKLISNAPEYLGTKIGLSVASGFATAYSQAQTTNQTNMIGGNTSSVTGSPGKFMMGQGMASGANAASQWFDDRAQQSFDAVYVPTVDEQGQPIEIAVNFTKEITIDYNPNGRKLNYEQTTSSNPRFTSLD